MMMAGWIIVGFILCTIPLSLTKYDKPRYGTLFCEPFVLLTMLYNEKKPERIAEYLECLEKNRQHPLIGTMHVLYDTSADDDHPLIVRDYIDKHQIAVNGIHGRATYGDFFALANTQYAGRRIIIANADIYFNDTLAALMNYDLHEQFLVFTRWDVTTTGDLVPFERFYGDSHDAWIFQSPICSFGNDRIQLGVIDCDGRIALQAKKAGLRIINPAQTIQCCHLHGSGIRHYAERIGPYPKRETLIVPGTIL